jgi:fatty-acyl-CoA synthase
LTASKDEQRNSPMHSWRRALEMTDGIAQNTSLTLPLVLHELARQYETAPAFFSEEGILSYGSLAERSCDYSAWALQQGLEKGDVVCLLMPNSPDYMAIWLGITRIGSIVSLINTNLTDEALEHSIRLVAPKSIIVGIELLGALIPALQRVDPTTRCWVHGANHPDFPRIDASLHGLGTHFDTAEYDRPTIGDTALYIYTSGTTGLPKAAAVSHLRVLQWSHWFAGMLDIGPNDRMYNCLPMYHSVGGVVATGATLVRGGAVVLRRRFSASRFWDDVADWNCTIFQYIGELCRYLADSPAHPKETTHGLRLCCGNGLRRDVWERFQRRFKIPQILEFYAATEANFSLYNCEGKPGAIGRIPPFLAHRFPVVLIRYDIETGEPMRGDDSFCIRCLADEPGEAICKISNEGASFSGRFEGYTDREATGRKIIRDVFTTGDAWYRTGDLMTKDRSGYFYFVDRLGDTFRWKGENVSTIEVAEVIAGSATVADAVVYGVVVPGTEGRVGMAAIVPGQNFDIAQLHRHLSSHLPEYAQPAFLRVCGEIETTGTFKPQKQRFMQEGYNPAVSNDPLYFNDRARAAFVQLDPELYKRIVNGELRV